MGDITEFCSVLYALNLKAGGEDMLLWIHPGNKYLLVRSFCKLMSSHSSVDFPFTSIRRSKAPLKTAFFGWPAFHGKILTIDKLRKHGIIIMDWCFMCNRNGELVDHLFLHCEAANTLWDEIFTRGLVLLE